MPTEKDSGPCGTSDGTKSDRRSVHRSAERAHVAAVLGQRMRVQMRDSNRICDQTRDAGKPAHLALPNDVVSSYSEHLISRRTLQLLLFRGCTQRSRSNTRIDPTSARLRPLEAADAAVRCMGLGATLCSSRTEADARARIHSHASGELSVRSLCMLT